MVEGKGKERGEGANSFFYNGSNPILKSGALIAYLPLEISPLIPL
jgi:hypothetical protein